SDIYLLFKVSLYLIEEELFLKTVNYNSFLLLYFTYS
ncbi:hypothetical protein M077_2395, partial [Bacteroides fragilis str. 2-F-2 